MLSRYYLFFVLLITLTFPLMSQATIVRFETSVGAIDVNLYDELTPITVENFLSYVESQSYDNSIIHRSVPGFIVQGGGFSYTPESLVQTINTDDAIANEPFFSNIRGTIAMAKIGSDPNSATSQWFFNLNNNASNLDNQNGGFTVFGEVISDGMDTVDALAQLTIFNLGGALTDIPLRDYTSEDNANGIDVSGENLVIVSNIQVVDDSLDTLDGVVPTLALSSSSSSGGGGTLNIGMLIFLLSITIARLVPRKK